MLQSYWFCLRQLWQTKQSPQEFRFSLFNHLHVTSNSVFFFLPWDTKWHVQSKQDDTMTENGDWVCGAPKLTRNNMKVGTYYARFEFDNIKCHSFCHWNYQSLNEVKDWKFHYFVCMQHYSIQYKMQFAVPKKIKRPLLIF